jgi:hypothetical protein
LGAGLATLAATACTSGGDDDKNNGTGPGTGGAATGGAGTGGAGTGGAGTGGAGTGGAGTGGVVGGDPNAVACGTASDAVLLDFAAGMGGASSTTDSTFGDFTTTFSGGTFLYPDALTSDVTGENWHISGELNDYGGFALYFADCTKVDASAYKGIKFTISGNTDGRPVTLNVGTAANTITSAWLQANKAASDPDVEPNFGRCTPAENRYDGTCSDATYQVTVTETATTVEIPWADLTGAKAGGQAIAIDPSEITFIGWNFEAPAGAGTATVTAYPVDVVIDDIGFML